MFMTFVSCVHLKEKLMKTFWHSTYLCIYACSITPTKQPARTEFLDISDPKSQSLQIISNLKQTMDHELRILMIKNFAK